VRRAGPWILSLLAIVAAIVVLAALTGSPTTVMSFPAAIGTSAALAAIIVFFAGRAYLKREPPFRLGLPVMALVLVLVWLAIAFVIFNRLYNSY